MDLKLIEALDLNQDLEDRRAPPLCPCLAIHVVLTA